MSDMPVTPEVAEFMRNELQRNRQAMHIEGFGPGMPPPPPLTMESVAEVPTWDPGIPTKDETGEPTDYYEPLETPIPKSPLVELGKKGLEPPAPMLPVGTDALLVMDKLASYKGQGVELSASDQAAIARIILEAAQRRLRGQLDAVRQQAPRRRKAEPKTPDEPKKRRGRPPKVKPADA